MTVSLIKPKPIDLQLSGHANDFVVVLRRYDVSDAPWGVHVLTVNLFEQPQITHRTIGLFSTAHLISTIHNHDVLPYYPDCEWYGDGQDVLGFMLADFVEDYIWTQVVPMEWHGHRHDMHPRVQLLSPYPNAWDAWYDSYEWDEWRRYVLSCDRRPIIDLALPA